MGSNKTKQETNSSYNTQAHSTETRTPFTSDQMKSAYNNYLGTAQDNYKNVLNSTNKLNGMLDQYMTNGGIGDTSYFKQAWDQMQGVDQSNLKKINSMSINPNDDKDWVASNDVIDKNTMLNWGNYKNQVMSNMIGSGMPNGSGHQTAAYKMGAMLNSQLASDRANRWQSQYNQNMQNIMAANNQLNDIYQKAASIGLDFAKLDQEGKYAFINAYNSIYNTQNDALSALGQAVGMGSDPTTKSDSTASGTQHGVSTSTQRNGFASLLTPLIGAGINRFTAF